MKNIFLITLGIMMFSYVQVNAESKVVVTFVTEGGVCMDLPGGGSCLGYATVLRDYELYNPQYPGDQCYRVVCRDPGENPCNIQIGNTTHSSFTLENNRFYLSTFDKIFNDLASFAEDEILLGNLAGSSTQKVFTYSVEGKLILIAFTIVWDYKESSSGIKNIYATLLPY